MAQRAVSNPRYVLHPFRTCALRHSIISVDAYLKRRCERLVWSGRSSLLAMVGIAGWRVMLNQHEVR